MADNNTTIDRLSTLLGFDPAKRGAAPEGMLADVIGEIREERAKVVRAKVKEQLIKAIELREQMQKIRNDFEAQFQKCEKELGKVLGQLDSAARGTAPPKEPAPDADTASEK